VNVFVRTVGTEEMRRFVVTRSRILGLTALLVTQHSVANDKYFWPFG
jgi:hypothetical protein